MPEDLKHVTFRPGPLSGSILERMDDTTAGTVVQRDLTRYYEILELALHRVELTEGEAGFLVDICNGTRFDPFPVAAQSLHYEVEDAEPEYDSKWGVDRPSFIAKLRGYSLLERAAICDAIERFWIDSYHKDSTQARLVHVGLIRG